MIIDSINKLASEIAKREGKKSQARVGDIREILGILCDILIEGTDGESCNKLNLLTFNGIKRAQRKSKSKN